MVSVPSTQFPSFSAWSHGQALGSLRLENASQGECSRAFRKVDLAFLGYAVSQVPPFLPVDFLEIHVHL